MAVCEAQGSQGSCGSLSIVGRLEAVGMGYHVPDGEILGHEMVADVLSQAVEE